MAATAHVRIGVSLDPIGHYAVDIVTAAQAAEECRFDGVLIPDELCDVWPEIGGVVQAV